MYKASDMGAMQFNPLTKERMIDAYPKLLDIIETEYLQLPDIDGIIRFILLCYDPKSPLVANERDLNYRKGIAAELSKLNVDDEEYMQTVYTFEHEPCLNITIRFLIRFAKSKEWAAIAAYEYAFWESIKKVIEPISGKSSKEQLESVEKKSKIKDEIEKDIKRLQVFYSSFFGEDPDLELRSKSRVTPESIAKLK